jgi:hypothetical protein
MKKLFLLGLFLFLTIACVKAQPGHGTNNENAGINTINKGTALGDYNDSKGQYAFIGGSNSKALGSHSFGFGKYVKANGDGSIVLGSGKTGIGGIIPLVNGIPNSFMVGFNTTIPSLFVQEFGKYEPGYVGIFHTNPETELDVMGTITTRGLIFKPDGTLEDGMVLTADGTTGLVKWAKSNGGGDSYWAKNGNNIFFNGIDQGGPMIEGDVGIGTNAPAAKLHVMGNIRLSGYIKGGSYNNTLKLQSKYGWVEIGARNSSWLHFKTDRAKYYFDKSIYTNTGVFSAYSTADLKLQTNGNTRITILHTNGNVGIGVAPHEGHKLIVAGNVRATGFISTNANAYRMVYGNYGAIWRQDGQHTYLLLTNSGNQYGGWNNLRPFRVTNSTGDVLIGNKLFVKHNGSIGIGTTDPQAVLHINDGGLPAGHKMLMIGDDSYFADIDQGNTLGIYGKQSLGTIGKIKLGSTGPTLVGANNCLAIGADENPEAYTLAIGGTIGCEKIVVKLEDDWPDFVFADDYKVPSLAETESFIKENKHLPGVPSAKEVREKGQDLAEMNRILLQKLEELTLLMIEQNKTLEQQQKEIDALKDQVNQ